MYSTVTCPTCGVSRAQIQCDNCQQVIPDADVTTTATSLSIPGGGSRFLCATCSTTVSLVVANLGTPAAAPATA